MAAETGHMPFDIFLDEAHEYPVIHLKNTITGCEAEIYAFGGLLNAFRIPAKNGLQNIVEGFADVADAIKNITNGFKSSKLSPFVCRMNKGEYGFLSKTYAVKKHFLSGHAIHGLLYDAVYKVTALEKTADYAAVTLEHSYAGTDSGYPFPYHVSICWKLGAGNQLSVATTVSHQNKTAIPLADGWHPYFSLGDTIDACRLQFSESYLLDYDASLLPTGKKTTDTLFVNGSLLKNISLDNGFEWVFPDKKNHCILSNALLQLVIEPDASYPVLQVYIPSHRKSIAIENLSGAPDNFNNGMHLVLLEPNQPKTFYTCYTVNTL